MKFDFTTIYDRRGRDAMAVDAVEKIPVFQPNEDGGHPEAAGTSSVRLLYDQR